MRKSKKPILKLLENTEIVLLQTTG
jgi:hypothetical protein